MELTTCNPEVAVVAMRDLRKMKVLVRESHKEKVAFHGGRSCRCGSNEGVPYVSSGAEDRSESFTGVERVFKNLRKKSLQDVNLTRVKMDALKLFMFFESFMNLHKDVKE